MSLLAVAILGTHYEALHEEVSKARFSPQLVQWKVTEVMSEEAVFLGSFGQQYGYLGRINKIRKQEFNRLEGNDRLIDRNWKNALPLWVIITPFCDITSLCNGMLQYIVSASFLILKRIPNSQRTDDWKNAHGKL